MKQTPGYTLAPVLSSCEDFRDAGDSCRRPFDHDDTKDLPRVPFTHDLGDMHSACCYSYDRFSVRSERRQLIRSLNTWKQHVQTIA